MKDTFRHKGLRKKLVETIKSKGISDKRVLEAIGNVPRHCFMDSSFVEMAYKDNAFPSESKILHNIMYFRQGNAFTRSSI